MNNKIITLGHILEQNSKPKSEMRIRKLCQSFARFSRWDGHYTSVPLDLFLEKRSAFWRVLKFRSSSDWSFRKYSKHIPFIFTEARRMGWIPDGRLSKRWRRLLQSAKNKGCVELLRYFSRQDLEPQMITHDMVLSWADQRVILNEGTYTATYLMSSGFESLLEKNGYANVNPVAAMRSRAYAIPLRKFPRVLRNEVRDFLKYRTAAPQTWDYECEDDENWDVEEDEFDNVELSARRQIRKPTAKNLEGAICRFYGFQIKYAKRKDVDSLRKLFRVKAFKEYVKWLGKDRTLAETSEWNSCKELIGSALQYPPLASSRKAYLRFREGLKVEKLKEKKRRRRERACLSYDVLKTIPEKIRCERVAIEKRRRSAKSTSFCSANRVAPESARLKMRELLMRWLLYLPWPVRNLCEARIDGDSANIFRRGVDWTKYRVLPEWAEKLRAKDENVELWQIHFSEEETSNRQEIDDLLPQELIDPLKAYLAPEGPRSILVNQKKVNELFINDRFGAVSPLTMYLMVMGLTLKYGGKRVSPQSVRDIWAFDYLEHQPKDYDGLALHLWHFDPLGTRLLYGPLDDIPPKTF